MTDVFDSSAIYYMTYNGISHSLSKGQTISLAPYETGNIVWKEHNIHKRLGHSEAVELVELLNSVIDKMQKLSLKGMQTEIFETASKLNITYYDASYIIATRRAGGSLITQDQKLAGKASSFISIKTCQELLSDEQYQSAKRF